MQSKIGTSYSLWGRVLTRSSQPKRYSRSWSCEGKVDVLIHVASSSSIAIENQRECHTEFGDVTYLMCLPDRAETSAAHACLDGLSPHLVGVHFGNVVELALERLAGGVLARARDLSNARSRIQNLLQIGV